MSDNEPDHDLLALLRQSLGLDQTLPIYPSETGVLESARFICDNSIDIALDRRGTRTAADLIWTQMQQREYSTETWAQHDLHPKMRDEGTVEFIFTMDLLNFCFWSELDEGQRFAVEYQGKRWTGYWSLVAALQRALDEGL